MPVKCKSCGTENRDGAKFCRSCGAPLKRKKKREKAPAGAKISRKAKNFWVGVLAAVVLIGAVVFFISEKRSYYHAVEVYNQYKLKYTDTDKRVFSGAAGETFKFEGLSWNITRQAVKKVYPYSSASDDPDFVESMLVSQREMREPVPHAKFMSLGLANDMLYAIKLEFGPVAEAQRQELKVANSEEKMYGRFAGLYSAFRDIFGPPSFEKYEVKGMPLNKLLRTVKRGALASGKPSNIYITWRSGYTKTELVFFGSGGKLHLTVRFLYMPVWKLVGEV